MQVVTQATRNSKNNLEYFLKYLLTVFAQIKISSQKAKEYKTI